MNVKNIMKGDVVEIKRDSTALDAMKIMIDKDIGSLLVDGRNKFGIITRKDIVNKVIAYGKDLSEVKVSEILNEPILTISSDLSVKEAARLMAKTNVRRFPVMEDGKVIGLISNSDILRSVSQGL